MEGFFSGSYLAANDAEKRPPLIFSENGTVRILLPFESRTPGEENQALSAISDSLSSRLSNLHGFQVVSKTTDRAKGHVARILDVQYAPKGSLLRSDK